MGRMSSGLRQVLERPKWNLTKYNILSNGGPSALLEFAIFCCWSLGIPRSNSELPRKVPLSGYMSEAIFLYYLLPTEHSCNNAAVPCPEVLNR